MKAHPTTRQEGLDSTLKDRRFLRFFALSVTLIFSMALMSATETPLENEADAVITSEVKALLLFNLLISSKTGTYNGVVTLSGRVDTVAEKVLGTNLATEISGVKRVINNMVISTVKTENN